MVFLAFTHMPAGAVEPLSPKSAIDSNFSQDVGNLILGDLAAEKGDAANTAKYFELLTRNYPQKNFLIQCFNGALQSQSRSLAETCYERLVTATQSDINFAKNKKPTLPSLSQENNKSIESSIPFDPSQPFRAQSERLADEESQRNDLMTILKARMVALTYPETKAPEAFIQAIKPLDEGKQRALIAQIARFLTELHQYSRGAHLFASISKTYPHATFKVFYAEFLRQTWQDKLALEVSKKAYSQESTPLTLLEYVESLQQNGEIDLALSTLAEFQNYPLFMDAVLRSRLEKIHNLRPESEFRQFLESLEQTETAEKKWGFSNLQSDTLLAILLHWYGLKDYGHTLKLATDLEKIILPRGENEAIMMLIYLKGASMLSLGDPLGQTLVDRVSALPRFAQMERYRLWRTKVEKEGLDFTIGELMAMEHIIRAPNDYLASARVLAEFHREDSALKVLEHGLKFHEKDSNLLYEAAMLAIKLGKNTLMEQYLKLAININPKNFHAHNALGYSWADLNINLPEAKKHIEIALSYQPLEPAILDSLGWYYYKAGDFLKSIEFLRRAYYFQHDPEIAAHLIEVLSESARKQPNHINANDWKQESVRIYQASLALVKNRFDKELSRREISLIEGVAQRMGINAR